MVRRAYNMYFTGKYNGADNMKQQRALAMSSRPGGLTRGNGQW